MKNKKSIFIVFVAVLIVISFLMTLYLKNSKTTQINNFKDIVFQEAINHFETLTQEDTWETIHTGFVVDGGGEKKNFGDITNPNWEKWQFMRQLNRNKHFYKITSLKTENTDKLPDEFEKIGLMKFKKDKNLQYYYETGKDLEKFDFIGRLKIKDSCLLCHAQQGYRLGDTKGGIRISIPTQTFEKSIQLTNKISQEFKWVVYLASFLMLTFFYILMRSISKRKDDVEKLNKSLEKKVHLRTKELQKNYAQLKDTQEELIQAEKLSSLAEMVAGVAHDINTPMGMALTDITYLNEETKELKKLYTSEKMTEKIFSEYLEQVEESSDLITINLKKGAQLIKSFKQVAVDQSSNEDRLFNIKETFDEVIISLNNVLKRTKHIIHLNIEDSLSIVSNPGSFSQILTNLIMNSIIHGFETQEKGIININVEIKDGFMYFIYKDNGKGIDIKAQKKIFNPFYTTTRNKGGSGLGMNIIYNLITQKFKGIIKIDSQPQEGVVFTIKIPI